MDIRAFFDPLPGSDYSIAYIPRVFVAVAPRPRAKLSDPYRDQESTSCSTASPAATSISPM
ncbi:MAG TPA: hypothetical protein VLO11_00620, partial [Luteolibacter sp.]|nr:hypothetical protein [Luteolibacter sp.]